MWLQCKSINMCVCVCVYSYGAQFSSPSIFLSYYFSTQTMAFFLSSLTQLHTDTHAKGLIRLRADRMEIIRWSIGSSTPTSRYINIIVLAEIYSILHTQTHTYYIICMSAYYILYTHTKLSIREIKPPSRCRAWNYMYNNSTYIHKWGQKN